MINFLSLRAKKSPRFDVIVSRHRGDLKAVGMGCESHRKATRDKETLQSYRKTQAAHFEPHTRSRRVKISRAAFGTEAPPESGGRPEFSGGIVTFISHDHRFSVGSHPIPTALGSPLFFATSLYSDRSIEPMHLRASGDPSIGGLRLFT